MKINRLETHDRLIELHKKQSTSIEQGLKDCLTQNSLSTGLQEYSPYIYIFAHPRTSDDGVNKRMLWQPRLTKPKAQTNSYLFRVKSKSDEIEICWMIPPREMWPEYQKGKITENEIVIWSIDQFENNRTDLEAAYPDDLSDDQCKNIYRKVAQELDVDIKTKGLYI